MKLARIILLGIACAATSTAAVAFQEQKSGGASPAPAATPQSRDAGPALAPGGDVALPRSKGTEVRIPGLGTLGVLPKTDFGLELLYGASDPKRIEDERQDQNDDLRIRGTVKHRF